MILLENYLKLEKNSKLENAIFNFEISRFLYNSYINIFHNYHLKHFYIE